jgi:putative cell wall-binding protein
MVRIARALRMATFAAVMLVIASFSSPSDSAFAAQSLPAGQPVVYGVVTPDPGGTFSGSISVQLRLKSSGTTLTSRSVVADAQGRFEFTDVPGAGRYDLYFHYPRASAWVSTGWAPPGGAEGSEFTLAADQVLEANGPLHRSGTITGTLSAPTGATLDGSHIDIYNSTGQSIAHVHPDPISGFYSVAGLTAGQYRVYFFDTNPLLVPEYYAEKADLASATPVNVDFGVTASGVNAELGTITAITGTVSYVLPDGSSAPLQYATVSLYNATYHARFSTTTDSRGWYMIPVSEYVNRFTLNFSGPQGSQFASEYWHDTASYQRAELLSVPYGTFRYGFDATLAREATITGRVNYSLGTPEPLIGAKVTLYRSEPGLAQYEYWDQKATDDVGGYAFSLLPAGDYALKVTDDSPKGLGSQYWQGRKFLSEATPIVVQEGQNQVLGDMTLLKRDIATVRLAGPDRFAAGVAMSRQLFPEPAPDVPVIYVASGLKYPDALAAGPAATKQGGTVLLVLPTEIPPSVQAELERLNPRKIVLVGGTASVSDEVMTDLKSFVDSPSDVVRIGGADRFEAANNVVRFAFGESGASEAFFVTGRNFPDALAAGAAAGRIGAPVILVDGGGSDLSESTTTLMRDLGVNAAYVVGGVVSITPAVEQLIRVNLQPEGPFDGTYISRFAGPDRYSAAASLSDLWIESDVALIATGTGFADALGGGPLGGAMGVPLFLSPPNCVPVDVIGALVRLNVNKVYLLGGTASLSSSVEDLAACS